MKNILDIKTKTWLIGFFEAEGSLTVADRGDLQFVITQGYLNIAVLYFIKDLLGFGSVNKQGPRTFRYVVQDRDNLRHIIDLLNGNLALPKKMLALDRFIKSYEIRHGIPIIFINKQFQPTRNDGWISGFADGDGCFHIGYVATKKTFPIRFILSQKDHIEHIRKVTGGSMEFNKTYQSYSIVIKDLPSSDGKNTEWLLDYFKIFPLKTTKLNTYYLWRYVRGRLLKSNLTPQETENIKILTKLINNQEIQISLEDGEIVL